MNSLYSFKKGLFCLSVFFLLLNTTNAQSTPSWNSFTDAKVRADTMRKYAGGLIRTQQFDDAILLLRSALAVSQKASLDSITGACYYMLAVAYRYKSNYDSGFFYLAKSKAIAQGKKIFPLLAMVETESYGVYNKIGKADSAMAALNQFKDLLPLVDSNSNVAARIEMYLGHNEKHQARYQEALAHYFKALRAFTFQNDSLNEGLMYVSLANALSSAGQNDQSLFYHQQAASLFNLLHRRSEMVNELVNLSDMYLSISQPDSAEVSLVKALPVAETINDKNAIGYIYLQLSIIYERRKKFQQAESYVLKAVHLADSLDNPTLSLESNQGLGELYMSEKQFDKALPFFEKQLAIATQEQNLEELIEATSDLSETEFALHNYAKAYDYKNLYSLYKDSSFKESSAKSMAEMETKYKAEKKEKEIALLKKDQQLDRLNLQKQKSFQVGAVIFLLLLVLIGFLMINRYRIVHRAKRLIEMEKMRNGLARDLHDDIGSTLTSINILSKMSLQQPAGDGVLFSNMQKIKDRSSAIMESVSDIVWAINPQNDTTEQMIFRMKEFAAEILEPLNINYVFKEEGSPDLLKLDIKKRKDFYLLFKEAVNNAAKYSHCKNLVIRVSYEAHCLNLLVEDDGTGFNAAEVKNGNGLRNMKARAASMGAQINIDTAVGKGTGIALSAPVT